MQHTISRRVLLKNGLIAGALLPAAQLMGGTMANADATALDANDPTAKALGFVSDTNKVDGTANPTHKPDQKCSNCAQYQGKLADAVGGCNIFAGKTVPAGGWCKVWAKKPGT